MWESPSISASNKMIRPPHSSDTVFMCLGSRTFHSLKGLDFILISKIKIAQWEILQ